MATSFRTNSRVAVAIVAALLVACDHKEAAKDASPPPSATPPAGPAPVIPPEDEVHAQYAGSESCKKCHEQAYAAWKDSHHGMAERNYQPELDEKAFKPRKKLHHHGQEQLVYKHAIASVAPDHIAPPVDAR